MICQTCHGNTVLPIKRDGRRIGVRVCPDCLNGYQHCCEGERPGNAIAPQTGCSDEPQAQNPDPYPNTNLSTTPSHPAEAGEP